MARAIESKVHWQTSRVELGILAAFVIVSVHHSYVGGGAGHFASLATFALSAVMTSTLFGLAVFLLGSPAAGQRPSIATPLPLWTQAALVAMLASMQDRNQNITGLCIAAFLSLLATTVLWLRGKLSEDGKLKHDLALVVAVAGVARVARILREPFGLRSDMLVLIDRALGELLHGRSPYRSFALVDAAGRNYDLPLTYLPGTWLAYLPARLLGFDLRFTNVLIEAIVAGALAVGLVKGRYSPLETRGRWLGASFLAAYALNGQFVRRVDAEISPLCAVLLLLFFALQAQRIRGTFTALGLGLATSPLAILAVPFVGAHVWRRRGGRSAALGLLSAAVIASAIVLPFALASPAAFRAGLWDHWRALAGYSYEWAAGAMMNVNFTLLFFRYDAQTWLPVIQSVLSIGIFLAGYWHTEGYRSPSAALAWASLVLYFFVATNIVVWDYLYQPVFLLFVLAALATWPAQDE
jgi:hypothetical protein